MMIVTNAPVYAGDACWQGHCECYTDLVNSLLFHVSTLAKVPYTWITKLPLSMPRWGLLNTSVRFSLFAPDSNSKSFFVA